MQLTTLLMAPSSNKRVYVSTFCKATFQVGATLGGSALICTDSLLQELNKCRSSNKVLKAQKSLIQSVWFFNSFPPKMSFVLHLWKSKYFLTAVSLVFHYWRTVCVSNDLRTVHQWGSSRTKTYIKPRNSKVMII